MRALLSVLRSPAVLPPPNSRRDSLSQDSCLLPGGWTGDVGTSKRIVLPRCVAAAKLLEELAVTGILPAALGLDWIRGCLKERRVALLHGMRGGAPGRRPSETNGGRAGQSL
ncbi:hypothetical protein NDU88_003255 [Pleurodeles waltl]|uniref:Uncharacterized protein n=1 Tax=Pleurodeles waltl TaxID=8319 RepID=A0AAV7LMH9_PLEWA|nr:hypothetical protein NDU88_003255 [Pleurodeles waltl]